jgi:hypothetical protein
MSLVVVVLARVSVGVLGASKFKVRGTMVSIAPKGESQIKKWV